MRKKVFILIVLSTFLNLNAAEDKLTLRMAGYDFYRTKPLFDGRAKIAGCNIEYRKMSVGDMNTNVFNGPQDLDVTEIGLHPYMLAYANDKFRDYTLLPIFPLRLFRHKSIFTRSNSDIKTPQDLKGKRIASPGYSSTSLTWIRGVLQDEYGIKPTDVKWVISQKDSSADLSGKVSKNEKLLPSNIDVTMGAKGVDESDLLLSGKADALFHAVEPKAYAQGDPKVQRLFEDYRSVEQAYYKKTGIFPIMHAVAIKTSLLKKHPWLAKSVFNGYAQARDIAYKEMRKKAWVYDMLPWYGQELKNTQELMGEDFYSYGLSDSNKKTLRTLFRYSYEQGLSKRLLTVEELFEKQ